ncbi:DASS family sodium-coupled anion symporter [Spiractinospora alimapuensis]|uniref:SLC13 family permease n=1 Tax=Spiractinospora alimapuensis TaxID=2820884 RepID=UPI001F2C536B|nr:DASS family sodium-coupled anion symporter [Spiractinospora alimapuensis]QVQ53513.1 DASS family sodium-coupled anion symporter [Spiractinospora alimapuensis]
MALGTADTTTGKEPERSQETGAEHTTLARVIGFVAGPLVGLLLYLVLPEMPLPLEEGETGQVMSVNGGIAAGITAWVAIWWATQPIPIPATSLLPLVLFPLLIDGVGVADISPSYGSDVTFLFMGGFMLALAMQKWDLHRRIALVIVSRVGSNTVGLIAGFMAATFVIGMWVSNTATAVMMLPVGLSVIGLVTQLRAGKTDTNFATALMLAIAYSASIGSVSTLIGTPPNVMMAGYLAETHDIHIGFGEWMMAGVPLAIIFLVLAWFLLAKVIFPPATKRLEGAQELIRSELAAMGPMKRGEKLVLAVFGFAAFSWIVAPMLAKNATIAAAAPWLESVSDALVAMMVAVLLFIIPVSRTERLLDWDSALKLPWGILLLFGGGIAISSQFTATGLSEWIGGRVAILDGVPIWALILAVLVLVLCLTELTSNTATAATFLPIMGGIAVGMDVDVLALVIPATLAASMSFMLPVATPPNAIAFGSGYVKITEMLRAGVWFNFAALAMIMFAMYALFSWTLGVDVF